MVEAGVTDVEEQGTACGGVCYLHLCPQDWVVGMH